MENNFYGHFPMMFLCPVLGVMGVLLICKAFGRFPFASYIGRYSIVILCIHYPLIVMVRMAHRVVYGHQIPGFVLFLATVFLSAALIRIVIRYLPWFVAQKDLIKVKSWDIK